MSTNTFMQGIIEAFLPEGAAWRPTGDFARLLQGIGDNYQGALDDIQALAYIRDPKKCPDSFLSDLEREHGIAPDVSLTDEERRLNLMAIRYKKRALATVDKLQRALDMAGFGAGSYGLQVTPNSPPADPTTIIETRYAMTAHEWPSNYVAGNKAAYAGLVLGGYYLVSGDAYTVRPLYPQAGQICARALTDPRSGKECAGYYEKVVTELIVYRTPPAAYWPLIFFVGGEVSRNPDGRIVGVGVIDIPLRRRQELHRLILRIVPLGVWAAMMVRYL